MKKKFAVGNINIVLVVLMFIESVWAYFRLPERVASHWGPTGQVDGYMSKFGGSFFMPILVLVVFLLLLIIPRIDPKKQNIAKFQHIFDLFITVFLLYMIYIYSLTLYFNIGHTFDFTRAILPPFGVLFYFLGWMLPQAEPNWSIGIRTAWTMSSDVVWRKTHQLGGTLFKISGVLALVGLLLPAEAFLFVFIPVIASSFYLVVYSYLEFAKLKKG